ncbi:hypothetical protein NKOR_00655 [Candidatus Nitrosopumilus koreensis AR1]|uniref:Uncharacterized protein n=1 Tax=Candidatus Nitrosopumilus koreensis AR1 TaxID=1229908 RepID=K0B3K5_9ARCH|nr:MULTISPECIES: hypothetical protein [Nitrosopumilus]AFS80049.1 hypothetical protein NKOR_00655 [Candidatus Nitrosopumilus koreensis AR1]
MPHFLEEISREQAFQVDYDPKFSKQSVFNNLGNEVRFFYVTLNESDFENNLHIYYNDKIGPYGKRYGWSLFDSDITQLSHYAKLLHSADFVWLPNSEQQNWNSEYDKNHFSNFSKGMDWMKSTLQEYDPEIARRYSWMIGGTSPEGPFMLMDGVHRALLTYMYYFIEKKKEFTPIEKAVCCLSKDTSKYYFRSIPKLR